MNKNIRTIGICIGIAMIVILSSFPITAETDDEEKVYTGPKQVYQEEKKGKPDKPKPDKPGGKPPEEEPQPDPSVNKWAVVIGISDYRGKANDLQYCDDDAQDMYAYLITKGYPEENIKLLLNRGASAENIMASIDWMNARENVDSEVVFFYSGHGYAYDGDYDGDGEYTDEAIVSADLWLILDGQLRHKFSTFESSKISFTFDTCFSGGMNDLAGPGRIVVAACGEEESSYETSDLQSGVFTYFYMEGLNTYYDTVEEAFAYAESRAHDFMEDNYGKEMNPLMYDHYGGDWKF